VSLSPDLILPQVVARHAAATPDRVLLQEAEGERFTYSQIHHAATAWADALATEGIQAGETVLTMLSPSGEWLSIWVGLGHARAVDTGVNTEFRGPMLRYAIERSKARLMIIDAELAELLTEDVVAGCALERIVVLGDTAPGLCIPSVSSKEFLANGKPHTERLAAQSWDIGAMVLTSGTTGRSKYVLAPWGMIHQAAGGLFDEGDLGPDDVLYAPLPVYHMAARYLIYAVVLAGGSVVLRHRFSLRAFWDDVRTYGCTVGLIFAFSKLLWAQPPGDNDRDNPLRFAIMAPIIPEYRQFAERFGVRIRAGYGMSEIGVPLGTRGDLPINAQTCGRPRSGPVGFEVRIVDEHDYEVPVGQVGELIVRSSEPWSLTPGYFDMPEATVQAWRNGWFHTGDGFKRDADGNFYFVDRIKDAIRRRGQNVSSFELEATINSHPGVAESAAVAYPAPGEEDEIRIFVVRQDPELSAQVLAADLREMLPRFMLPRYVEFVDSLPKTEASFRVKKAELRAQPLGPDADLGDRR
jgi:crotonobetaine/carnitine-CoA ligase